jgi:hypothetical protein
MEKWHAANSHMRNTHACTAIHFAVVASDEAVEASAEATAHQRLHSPLSWRWRQAGRDFWVVQSARPW